MQLNGWDHALKVTSGGKGLVGHAGSILLRKAADQTGLSAVLSAALQQDTLSTIEKAVLYVTEHADKPLVNGDLSAGRGADFQRLVGPGCPAVG